MKSRLRRVCQPCRDQTCSVTQALVVLRGGGLKANFTHLIWREETEVPLKMLLTKGWMIIPEFSTGYILIPSVN